MRIGVKLKLILFISTTILMCILAVGYISFSKSKAGLTTQVRNQLESSGESIGQSLEWFMQRTKNFTSILNKNRLIEGLIIAYESSFFGSSFSPGEDLEIYNKFYEKLDDIYGGRKEAFLNEYELKDILLVSLDSQVIFTAKNSQNKFFLGKNLLNGVYQDTPLKTCYEKALDSESAELFFSGFFFNKVTNLVDAFICGKKLAEFGNPSEGIEKGDEIGVVVVQLNTEIMTNMLTSRTGMGDTGQSYLVGQDNLLRSDFYLNSDKFNAVNSMKNNIKIETDYVQKALAGKNGTIESESVYGEEVLAYYQPFSFMGNKFALVTEKATSEVYESVRSTMIYIITAGGAIFLIVLILALVVTNSILKPIIEAKNILENVSNKLKTSATSLQTVSISLREGADDTSSSVHETVSTMNELSQMVNQNLNNVKKTTTASHEAMNSVDTGKRQTTEVLQAVSEISDKNEMMVQTINKINQKMGDFKSVISNIAEKTNIINDIVSQTKLLSFNASVEAARAGELGKGFAVVAEEVGNLAAASGTASEEIEKLLRESVEQVEKMIVESTGQVDRVKRETLEKIEVGKAKATSCEESLVGIQKQMTFMTDQINEINVASNEQANGISDISKAMTNLSETSQTTSKIANDTLSYSKDILEKSESLVEISNDLQKLVSGQ